KRAVGRPVVRNLDRQRTDMDIDAKFARHFAQSRERSVHFFFDDNSQKLLTLGGQDIGHLGGEHIGSSGCFRLADHAYRIVNIGAGRKAGAHLDHRRLETAGTHADAPSDALWPASNESSLPARSSACSSSLPPTCVVPMKICGTVMRPFARSIISCRRLMSPLTSISL